MNLIGSKNHASKFTSSHCRYKGWGCPNEVSIPHGESFLALGFAYPLFYSLQSRQRYPTQLQDSLWISPIRQNWSATLYEDLAWDYQGV